MATAPKILRTVPSLRRALEPYRKAGASIALVPTMGALHRGHMALVREARRRAKRVVVSIFVNPTQFAPHEDFASYPRSFATDLKALRAENVDVVWAPAVDIGSFREEYANRIVATLFGDKGNAMRCGFRLFDPQKGFPGGGTGDCLISSSVSHRVRA